MAAEPVEVITASRAELDLTCEAEVAAWMQRRQPDVVVVAAARVGGILANASQPVDFLADNLRIELNLIRAAHAVRVAKLLFLGSSCIYPRDCPQPIREEYLLTGPLEPTNEWYALAKIAGIKLCQAYRRQLGADFISAMPTNLYGPGDNFDLASSHVVPALMRKLHEARLAGAPRVPVWGTGTPAARVPPRRRPRRCLRLPAAPLFGGAADQCRLRRGPDHRRAGGHHRATSSATRASSPSTRPSPTARRASSWMSSACLGSAGSPDIPLREGLASTYAWYRSNAALARGLATGAAA